MGVWGNLAGASSKTEQQIEREIEAVLAERHPTDTPEWWRALGPTAPRVILRMLDDTDRIYHRVRLTQALGWFDDREALEFLKAQAKGAKENAVKNAAIRSVGHSQGAKELDFISEFLKSPDPQTRLSAAQALQRLDDPAAEERLRRYMEEEKASWLVAKLKGELPKPTGMLTPVASSEDHLSAEWEGAWSGHWLAVASTSSGSPSGIEPVAVHMEIKLKDSKEISGEIRVKKNAKRPERIFTLKNVSGKKERIEGLLERRVPAKPLAPNVAFQAEILQLGGKPVIELRSKGSDGAGGVGVLGLLTKLPAR